MKRISLLILLYIATISSAIADANKMFSYSQNIEVFSDVIKQLNIHYVDTIDIDKSVKQGISAMLATLDPYTIYFTEEEAKQFAEQNTGEYAGVPLHFHFSLSCIGEGNGNPLQCSCLENPGDGGAWWVVYWVAQSWTRLKRLSSSSMLL